MPGSYMNLHLQLMNKMSACGKSTIAWRLRWERQKRLLLSIGVQQKYSKMLVNLLVPQICGGFGIYQGYLSSILTTFLLLV
uniref:Uncharacterized protein n=1 Tax=Lotus japonicus TaxID=34305 RepID=I3T5B2_LOTJA|nr:unknown [Lotus japonicus]